MYIHLIQCIIKKKSITTYTAPIRKKYVTDNAKFQCKSIYTSFKFAFNKMSNLREKRPLLYANEDWLSTVNHSCPYRHSGGLYHLQGGEGQMDGRHHRHCWGPPQSASPPHRNFEPLWFLLRISPRGPCLCASSFSHPCHDSCLCVFLSWTWNR